MLLSPLAPRPPPWSRTPPPSPPPRRAGRAGVVLLALLLGACGEPAAPEAPAGAAPRTPRARVVVPLPSELEKARYALARVLTGPVPQEVLPIPVSWLYAEGLRLVMEDLVVLREQTLTLLADPALITRVTGPEARDRNPWQDLLEVLGEIPQRSFELVQRWTEPTLSVDDSSLRLRAAALLARTGDARAAPLLLRLLEESIEDRQVSREALSALAGMPEPWPGRAAVAVWRRGLPELWQLLAAQLAERLVPGRPAPFEEGLLAWWALLAEGSGPRSGHSLPREMSLPWSTLPQWVAPGEEGAVRGWPHAPSALALGASVWLSAPLDASAQRNVFELLGGDDGTGPAADARCALARRGRAAYVARVTRDRGSTDAALRERAQHCMLEGQRAMDPEEVHAKALAWLEGARGRGPKALDEVVRARKQLPSGERPEDRDLLVRVLRELRPGAGVEGWGLVLHTAYDALVRADDERAVGSVRAMLRSVDASEQALALHLIERSRDPAYLPDLERRFDGASPEGREQLKRTLMWLITAGGAVEPQALEAFAARFAGWVSEADDARARTLSTGLLDLGEAGARRFAEALAGPRRRVFVEALRGYPALVPLEVAEALADGLEGGRPAEERTSVLLVLWRTAPSAASAALVEARARLGPAEQRQLDVVLDFVRHRAARP